MKNWKKIKLSCVSANKDAIVSGPFGSNLKVSDYLKSGIPILRLQNIGKGYFINKDIKYISAKKAEELKYHSFKAGDIVLAKLGMPIGKTCIVPNEFKAGIIVADVVRIRPDKEIVDYKFLEYFLNTDESVKQLTGNVTGATRPRVNLSDVRNIEFNLPPLDEQKRIVAILDECFVAIDKAKANAEQNLKNAKELFESYLEEVFAKKGEGWEEKRLGEVCEIIMGQSPKGETYNSDGHGVPLINGPVEFGPKPFSSTIMSKYTTEPTKFCKQGDLILCVRGSTTGRMNIAGFDGCIGRGVAAIRYTHCQEWVNFLILSSRKKIYNLGSGATFPNVSSESLKDLRIPVAPLKIQQSMVNRFKALQVESQKIEAIYKKKIQDLEDLKKSILEKAFRGELKMV